MGEKIRVLVNLFLQILSLPRQSQNRISSKVYEKPYSNVVVLRTETVNMKLAVMATMKI